MIANLVKYGYLQNISLRADDPVLLGAIESYRQFMQASESLSIDDLFAIPRCGCPDFGPDAVGSGGWPVGCHPKWPNNHAVTYQVNKTGMPSFLVDIFEEAWSLMTAAMAYVGVVIVREDANDRANSLVTWQRGNGWIGLATVPSNPRCGDRMFARFDNKYQPAKLLNQWSMLFLHELIHNLGLGHTSTGVMSPRIISDTFTPTILKTDASFNRLKSFYGGEPVVVVPPNVPVWGIYPGGSDNS